MENILKSSADKDFDEAEQKKMGDIVAGSVITTNGRLADKFKYIADLRREKNAAMLEGDFTSEKKVLVLGAGYVSAPVVEYLTRDTSLGVTVAAALKSEADKVVCKDVYLLSDMNYRSQKGCHEP